MTKAIAALNFRHISVRQRYQHCGCRIRSFGRGSPSSSARKKTNQNWPQPSISAGSLITALRAAAPARIDREVRTKLCRIAGSRQAKKIFFSFSFFIFLPHLAFSPTLPPGFSLALYRLYQVLAFLSLLSNTQQYNVTYIPSPSVLGIKVLLCTLHTRSAFRWTSHMTFNLS